MAANAPLCPQCSAAALPVFSPGTVHTSVFFASIFTARCYAERGYEIACRLSVCLSVRRLRLSTVIT